jgi:hypothetical protein
MPDGGTALASKQTMRKAASRVGRLFAIVAVATSCARVGHESPSHPNQQSSGLTLAGSTVEPTVEVKAPKRALWVASVLSSEWPTIAIRISNPSDSPLDVANVRAYLEVEREGIPFHCPENVGPNPRLREPAILGPHASYVFERTLDCALPLTGTYHVRVAVSFGRDAWREPRQVRTFTLAVSASAPIAPRPIDRAAGLWAAVGASGVLSGESGAGSGRIAVSLVNAGPSRTSVPPLHLALRVYRGASPIPCEDEPIPLHAPRFLAPGEVHREPVSVSCLGLSVPGQYDVVARLQRADAEDLEIGRLRIEISNDPSRSAFPR